MFFNTSACTKMGLRLFDWGGRGPLAIADSWRVQYIQGSTSKDWTCASYFSKWEVSVTLSVDFLAMEATVSLMVTDCETNELAPHGVLLQEMGFLMLQDVCFH